MKLLCKLLAVFWLSLLGWTVLAQPARDRWDQALGHYYDIVLRCMELRDRINAGDEVQGPALQSLLQELETLRTQLQAVSGSMPPRVRSQFRTIRQLYASGRLPLQEKVLPNPCRNLVVSPASGWAPRAPYSILPESAKPLMLSLMLSASFFPEMSAGAMFQLRYGVAGGFVKGVSNFQHAQVSYACQSDGRIPEGYFWGTGNGLVSRFHLVAGPVWWPASSVGVYAGAGYGRRWQCWEDSTGAWAKVEDLSCQGVVFEGGILFKAGRVQFSAGVSTISFGSASLELGVGWCFSR